MKRLLRIFLLSIACCGVLTACESSADELAIQASIESMQNAIEQHDVELFMENIAGDFSGQFRQDKKRLRNFVQRHLDNNRVIHVYLANQEIEIEGDYAKVRFNSGLMGGPAQVPERGQLYIVETDWVRLKGNWKMQRAQWRPKLFVINPG